MLRGTLRHKSHVYVCWGAAEAEDNARFVLEDDHDALAQTRGDLAVRNILVSECNEYHHLYMYL